MDSQFKKGEMVVNKANRNKVFTVIEVDIDNINANLIDGNGNKVTLPVAALEKYTPPEGPKTVTWLP